MILHRVQSADVTHYNIPLIDVKNVATHDVPAKRIIKPIVTTDLHFLRTG
jgi:hypothetical protein